jgi:hypothetical protein
VYTHNIRGGSRIAGAIQTIEWLQSLSERNKMHVIIAKILIPIIAGLLFLGGGQINKWIRWTMGSIIGLIAVCITMSWWTILYCFVTYFIATSAFPYGEKSWLNKFMCEYVKWFVCGFVFGLAAFPILGYWSVVQAMIAGVCWVVLKILDDKNIVKNPWQELLRGLLGTVII